MTNEPTMSGQEIALTYRQPLKPYVRIEISRHHNQHGSWIQRVVIWPSGRRILQEWAQPAQSWPLTWVEWQEFEQRLGSSLEVLA